MKKFFLFAIMWLVLLVSPAQVQPVRAQGPVASGAQVGKPWRGAPGIKETVAQIMERAAGTPPSVSTTPRIIPRRSVPRTPNTPNPNRASTSRLPLSNAAGSLTRENPQTIGTSFLGAQLSEAANLKPPDSMGAVGPSQVLVVTNGRIKVFDKNGTLASLNSDLTVFFASVLGPSATLAFDPQARYDRLSSRWFVTALDDGDGFPLALHNRVMIAVSSSSTITSSTSFSFFQFQFDLVGTTPNADTGGSADYDSLGIDSTSLYVGVNVFDSSGSFSGTTGFVVNKADLLAGALTVTAFRQMATCSGCLKTPSPRGVDNDDPTASEGYFISVDENAFSVLNLRQITYPGGIPAISSPITLSVPTTTFPINVVAQGVATPLDAIDDRLFAAQIRKNKLTGDVSLWTAHNIEVNTSGVGMVGGGRTGSRWYEIRNITTTTPTLRQSGTLFDSAASNPRSYWMPSVAMSGQGHMALGSSFASVNDYAGVSVAGRLSSDALGATQPFTIAQAGVGSYSIGYEPACGCYRWGDYSQTVVDPTDDMTMWTFQEYANATNSWGVRAIQLVAPPPATPSSAFPSSVALGQAGVSVIITGTSSSGSGFFDPGTDVGGPGYANHLRASVSGGVIVNSTAFISPTQLSLNISTYCASTGAKNVTITNSDGQSQTGVGILTITAAPTSCYQYIFPLIFK